jgi:hypothetical protein
MASAVSVDAYIGKLNVLSWILSLWLQRQAPLEGGRVEGDCCFRRDTRFLVDIAGAGGQNAGGGGGR